MTTNKPAAAPKPAAPATLRDIFRESDPRTAPGIAGAYNSAVSVSKTAELLGADFPYSFIGGAYYHDKVDSEPAEAFRNALFRSTTPGCPFAGPARSAFDMLAIGVGSYAAAAKAAAVMPEVQAELKKREARAWIDELDTDKKSGRISKTPGNLVAILEHDSELAGKIVFDEFAQDVVMSGRPWRDAGAASALFTDADEHRLREHLRDEYGVDFSRDTIEHAVAVVADKNRAHPVRARLAGLRGKWDGVKRLETLFIDYLGSADNAYTRLAAKKWFMAAVSRIFEPGTKFEYVVVLEGGQGARKSTFVETIGMSSEWVAAGLPSLSSGKETVEALRGKWIVEIAELSGLSKREDEEVKDFISLVKDRMRPAYARRAVDFPRQCVFMGTVNKGGYLRDETGNRRWWPIKVTVDKIDIERLKAELEQIWAEAVALYDAEGGRSLYLDDPAAEAIAVREQSGRVADDEWQGLIQDYCDTRVDIALEAGAGKPCGVAQAREKVCVLQVWSEVFNGKKEDLTTQISRRIGRCLALMGWNEDKLERHATWGQQRFKLRPVAKAS